MKKTVLAGLLAAVVSVPAMASDFSYDYVELSAGKMASDFDAVAIEGSYSVSDAVYVQAALADVEHEDNSAVDGNEFSLTVGAHRDLAAAADLGAPTDLYYQGSFIHTEANGNDDDGFGAEIGVRSTLNVPNLEVSVFAGYAEVGDEEGSTVGVAAQYQLSKEFSVGAEYARVDHEDELMANLRYHF